MTPSPQSILKTVFGYDTFKPLQLEIIEGALARRDSLVIMPTGGGKSLCYQIPALLLQGLTVVVSPLISLMKDQVEQMRELGVPALFLNSSLSLDEYRVNVDKVRSGAVKLLYVAPETLLTDRILSLLNSVPLDLLAIDEAHCISDWGHDFRPEYRQISKIRERFPGVVCMALTATATPRVRMDIQTSLHLDASNEFLASFDRENLLLEVAPKTDALRQTLDFLRRFPKQSGIIYCFSRKGVDDLAGELAARGFSARPYHAGLDDDTRMRNQEAFIRDDVQIIVATIAFGMGINKPNVRFVIHYDLPKSLEGYYQEIGRAGRDGLKAHCLLLFAYSDIQKQRYFIDQKEGTERQVAYHHLSEMVRFAESETCRRVPLLKYFGEHYSKTSCEMCDRCINGVVAEVDITIPAQKFLSCVKRTGEVFGMVHVVDVLLGSENQKVIKYGHHTLTTYGIGRDLARGQWMNLARQLVRKGYLEQDAEHGSLRLTRAAYAALKNNDAIFGVLAEESTEKPAGKSGLLSGENYDRDLFEILRSKRKELADKKGVPPYVIFSDRSLVDMATYFPTSKESFLKMFGVGQVKLEHYGVLFLELIRAYAKHRGLTEKPVQRKKSEKTLPEAKTDLRHMVVGRAYNEGLTIGMLMEQYKVEQKTILDHLCRFVIQGYTLRRGEDITRLSRVNQKQKDAVMLAFADLGADRLKPVFDRMAGAVSYDDLYVLRLDYLTLSQADDDNSIGF